MQNNNPKNCVDQSHRSIIDELCDKQLPVLPPGAPFLLKSLSNANISLKALSGVIEHYPIIAARLISLANSAWSSPVSSITSLEIACSRLGFGIVRSTSVALAVSAPFNSNKCPAFDPERFWSSALLAADACEWLASMASHQLKLDTATARSAGLLHNLGILWLTDQLPVEMQQIYLHLQQESDLAFNQALQEALGIDFFCASGRLAEVLELPQTLVVALSEQGNENYRGEHRELATVVGIAVKMVSSLFRDQPWQDDETRCASLGIAPQSAEALFERLATQFGRTLELANLLFSD